MWSVFQGSGRTTATCWFCHETTQLKPSETKHNWNCSKCDNQNTLDAAGNIIDSRVEMYQESPLPLPRRLPGYENDKGTGSAQVFCSACQRNQELVCQILAAYLPEDDDPEYEYRIEHAEEYAQSLRRRYPLVCRSCQAKVDERLQQQAQWMCRRELANALKRSESARKYAPRIQPQPTLRRKRLVVAWIVCALFGLLGCPVTMWLWYTFVIYNTSAAWSNILRFGIAGTALAVLTYFSRLLNPLWLYIAYNPGMRITGLPLYKRRLVRLSVLRFFAVGLQAVSRNFFIWIVVVLYDLTLSWLAVKNIRAYSGLRPRSRQGTSQGSKENNFLNQNNYEGTTASEPLNVPLSSFKSLSFGASEVNMDQDDDLIGSEAVGLLESDRWRRRSLAANRRRDKPLNAESSGDDETSAVNTEIVSGLDTLSFGMQKQTGFLGRERSSEQMDVDVLSAMMGGESAASNRQKSQSEITASNTTSNSSTMQPRPFEPFKFRRDVDTGLETKLSAFSLDDKYIDDGSYQGLLGSSSMDRKLLGIVQHVFSLRVLAGTSVLVSWLAGTHVPLWSIWAVRATLIAALAAAIFARTQFQQNTGRREAVVTPSQKLLWIAGGSALLLLLAGIPLFSTLKNYPLLANGGNAGFYHRFSSPIYEDKEVSIGGLADEQLPGEPAIAVLATDYAEAAIATEGASLLLRWPLARRTISCTLWLQFFKYQATSSSWVTDVNFSGDRTAAETTGQHLATLPQLVQIDWSIELASLVFLAFA
ncbi:hypothetical protein GGI25_001399 [Coemansia spiralis]|uniref:Ima1 N-terminal domain-containing protein n=2 Tax=Coemansia TaxID=4863 RepID=A0A9W8L013_9FUNG|nr:hypothetical protein EDC05_001364 [Coemansia umbellata]KAJ2624556.1 hypothetical protein GGI26_001475 [Coemansia sp. RSA 1358]KAJ2679476.1 hypothetical protein GGI25_001399 [Coemansia spiralis]